nr:TVP38/TMEM64 family protein [Amylibacter sp.]
MKSTTVETRRLWPILGIALVAIIGFFALRDVLSFDTLRDNRMALIAWRDSNYMLAALVFTAVYVAVVGFSLPGAAVMTLAGGFLFGIFPGALFCVIGATLGAMAIFLAAKTGLGDALHAKLTERPGLIRRMESGLRENEISYLFLMRLVPAIPFFLANLAPAFLGVGLRNFTLTTFFGIMPGSIVYTSVGSGLGAVFASGDSPDLGLIFEPCILGPILGLCALAALPIVLKRFVKKKDVV